MNPDVRVAQYMEDAYPVEPAVEISEGEFPAAENWWRRIARWSLYAIALLFPILFYPSTIPPTFIKQVLISVLAFIAFISWLGESLLSGRIYYKRSLINAGLGLLLVVLFLSTLFSFQALRGLIGADDAGERFTSFLVFAVIFFVAGGVFYTERESQKFAWAWLGGGLLLGALSLLQFFAPKLVPLAALARADVNPVGTTNAVAILLGFYFLFAVGVLANQGEWIRNRLLQIGLIVVTLVSALNLVVINFRTVWIAVAAGVVVLLGLQFRRATRHATGAMILRRGGLGILFLALALSTFFILSSTSIVSLSQIPVEVGPSYKATVDIARQTLKSHLILGSGPGTFGLDYSMFRDPAINFTNFWGVRFNSGAAFVPTVLATTGVLGVLALILFSLAALISFLRGISRRIDDDPFLAGGVAAVVFGLIIWWLYTTTFAFHIALFALMGILISRLNETTPEGEPKSWWRVSERSAVFATPWATFVTSLVIIFLMVGGVAFLYYTAQQYAAAVNFTAGVNAFGKTERDIDGALNNMNRAVALAPDNDLYYRSLAQVALAKVQVIVNAPNANQNPNLLNDFRAAVQSSISYAQRASDINSKESLNWSTLGFVYQSLVSLIDGSETAALSAYDNAAKYDPKNPIYEFNKASVYSAMVDRAQLRLSQSGVQQQAVDAFTKQIADNLENARVSLVKYLQLKPDYPQANYLLAQVLIRQGNLAGAITQVETVKQLAFNDIGVAFQLGVLYYQAGQFDKAEGEFRRAVSINPSYSNARYFLGLLADRRKDTQEALNQFAEIQKFNPDNSEVQRIIKNLQLGKAALDGISPPAPAPTQRKEPPVNDSGQPTGNERPRS